MIKLLLLAVLVYIASRVIRGLIDELRAPRPVSSGSEPIIVSSEAGQTPHEILGVEPGTPLSEIRIAYQKLVQQYHPDRVADMGPELQELAEQRTKEINAAYQKLKR